MYITEPGGETQEEGVRKNVLQDLGCVMWFGEDMGK